MQRELIKNCEGKQVKLVLNNEYILRGLIKEVFEDCILFVSPEKKSYISIDLIKEVVF